MARPVAFFLLQALLVAAAIPAALRSTRLRASSPFVLPQHAIVRDAQPLFTADFLPTVKTTFVHAATLAEMPNGDVLAAWYGGYDEISPDVRIFAARLDHATGRWSEPRPIADRAGTARGLGMRIKSLGNPVLYRDRGGLKLYFVAVVFGGWGGSTICLSSSPDGVQWSPPRHVQASPFFNLGMLVRGIPWTYADGTTSLPIYHEMGNKWAGVARVDAAGRVIDSVRIEDQRTLIQPWTVATDPDHALAFLRWGSPTPGHVTFAASSDRGATWGSVRTTSLVHRDSAVAVIQLDDGSLLAIYNNSPHTRRSLALARTRDAGATWTQPVTIEDDRAPDDNVVRREYSYPYVLRGSDGRIHLVYTYRRTAIRHIVFNDAWVAEAVK